jgi:hypothetical protein
VQTPAQQQTTMQLLSDLVALACAQANAPKANPGDQGYLLRNVIPNLAASISVAAANAKETGIVQAVAPVATPQRGITAATMDQLVKAVHPAIKASKTFAATTPPPSVTGNEAAPPPASAPTTGPIAIPGASAIPIGAPGVATTRPAAAPAPGARPGGTTTPPPTPPGGRPPTPPPGGRPPTPAPAPRPATPAPGAGK